MVLRTRDIAEGADQAGVTLRHGMPLAAELEADPGLLVSAVGYHRCGAPRAHIVSPDLERAVVEGEIRISDFLADMPLRPPAAAAEALAAAASRTEGEAHWHLKWCAWAIAGAMLPMAELCPEAPIDPRRRKRADLIATDKATDRSVVFEVGAVSNDSILVALDAGHTQVVVLPHQPDGGGQVVGYLFANSATTVLSAPSAPAIRDAQSALAGWMRALIAATPMRPRDAGRRSWLTAPQTDSYSPSPCLTQA